MDLIKDKWRTKRNCVFGQTRCRGLQCLSAHTGEKLPALHVRIWSYLQYCKLPSRCRRCTATLATSAYRATNLYYRLRKKLQTCCAVRVQQKAMGPALLLPLQPPFCLWTRCIYYNAFLLPGKFRSRASFFRILQMEKTLYNSGYTSCNINPLQKKSRLLYLQRLCLFLCFKYTQCLPASSFIYKNLQLCWNTSLLHIPYVQYSLHYKTQRYPQNLWSVREKKYALLFFLQVRYIFYAATQRNPRRPFIRFCKILSAYIGKKFCVCYRCPI
uniref:PB263R n=1 Tax=African swine fever virus TaxID=10497 RepID=A0A6G7KTW3_ASF